MYEIREAQTLKTKCFIKQVQKEGTAKIVLTSFLTFTSRHLIFKSKKEKYF